METGYIPDNRNSRQGVGLTSTLFTVFMDKIIKKCNQQTKSLCVREILVRRSILDRTFSSNIIIMAEKKEDLQASLER